MKDGNENGAMSEELSLSALLKDGLFMDGDWVETKDQDPTGEVRLIQLADVGDGVFRNKSSRFLTIEKARELRCTFLTPGDILVARMPEPLGRACIFPGIRQPAVTAVDVCILRPNPASVRSDWLVNAINAPAFRSAMAEFVRGTTRQRISRKNLGKLTLHVPDIKAQAASAGAIDRIEARHGKAARHAADARTIVERLRTAVLGAACAGRLTADWCEKHPDVTVDSVIERARDRRLQELGTRRFDEPRPHPPTHARHSPPNWSLVPLGLLLRDIKYGTSKRSVYDTPGTPILRIPNVSAGLLDVADLKFAELDERERKSLTLRAGDLLMIRSNGSVQRVGLTVSVTSAGEGMAYAGYLMRLRTDEEFLDPYFLRLALASPELRAQIELPARSTSGVHNINTQEVRGLSIALPPLGEQREIVRRTDAMLATADRVAAQVDRTSATLARVSKTTLAKAFRGELLPTEAALVEQQGRNFESAEELLIRIDAEEASQNDRGALGSRHVR